MSETVLEAPDAFSPLAGEEVPHSDLVAGLFREVLSKNSLPSVESSIVTPKGIVSDEHAVQEQFHSSEALNPPPIHSGAPAPISSESSAE